MPSSREVIAKLEAEGWVEIRQRGSHKVFAGPDGKGRAVVPHPKKDLPPGTVRSIETATGVAITERPKRGDPT